MNASEAQTHTLTVRTQQLKSKELELWEKVRNDSFYKLCVQKIEEAINQGHWDVSFKINKNDYNYFNEVIEFLRYYENYMITTSLESIEPDNIITKLFNKMKSKKNNSEILIKISWYR